MSARSSTIPAVAVALAAFAMLAWKFDFLCDDAYISFRYSRHLSLGEGLRYNLGSAQPVEGYSNFLWVLWLGLVDRLGLDILLWSRITSAICGAWLVAWLTVFCARRFDLGGVRIVALGLFVGTLPPMALWATSGLATMPAALCVFATYERLLGNPQRPRGVQAGLFGLLAALLRADGAAWIVMLLVGGGLVWFLGQRPPALRRALIRAGVILLIGVGLHVAWRLSYYGDYLPNTARVKAGYSAARLGRGLDYVITWFLAIPSILLACLAATRGFVREWRAVWLPSGAVLLGTMAYSVWTGGDFMPMGRFLFPAVPFLVLLLAAGLKRMSSRVAAGVGVACVTLSLLTSFNVPIVPPDLLERFLFRARIQRGKSEVDYWRGMKRRAEDWATQGRALKLCTQPGESMIFAAPGALGYFSELKVYDTFGLVSPEVLQHGRTVADASPGHDFSVPAQFFFSRHPTYVASVVSRVDSPHARSLLEFWEQHPWHDWADLERHPLPADQGFRPDSELWLLRLTRWE